MTRARRWLWLIVIGGGAGYVLVRRRSSGASSTEPSWPPLRLATTPEPAGPTSAGEAVDGDVLVPEESARYVEPVDGECPLTHPIKANANSGIYHLPAGRFYARTRAERCYAEASEAEADGYRAAKDPATGRVEQGDDRTAT